MRFIIIVFISFIAFNLKAQQHSTCEGDCENGKGISSDSKGNRYEGTWLKGKKNGFFKIFYSSGSRFEGNIVNDTIKGQGIYETKSYIIKGELNQVFGTNRTFKVILNGEGEYINKEQNSGSKGFFIADKLNGKGEVWIGQQRSKGNFINGKLEGIGTVFYENGDVFEGKFVNGIRNGKGVETFARGGQLKGTWVNNEFIDGPSEDNSNSIKLIRESDGAFKINVSFEGQLTIPMVFDTGADILLLSREHFSSLLSEGKIKEILDTKVKFKDAGGNTNNAITYVISKIKVGSYELEDVICAVNPSTKGSPNLFGMSAIQKLGEKVTLNFQDNTLEVR